MQGNIISDDDAPAAPPVSTTPLRLVIIFSACLVLLGAGGPLLLRVYFVHGGRRLWLSTFIQLSGWPLLLPPIICVLLFRRRSRREADDGRSSSSIADQLLPWRLAGAIAVLGAFFGVACFVYSLGVQALPLSTSSLLLSTQLAFNAVFAFLFAGLRLTPFSANAVVLLIIGPAVLGVGPSSSSVTPAGESSRRAHWTGFVETIAAAAMCGLVLPLVEAAMSRYGRRRREDNRSYVTVMQIQATMGAAGSAVCLLGMAVTGDFRALPKEAAGFGLGETKYFLVFVFEAVSWQLFNLGIMGLIVCASSLLAGIMIAVLLPLSQVLAVVFLREKFDGTKGIALVLSLWGFVSYLYGENNANKKKKKKKRREEEAMRMTRTRQDQSGKGLLVTAGELESSAGP
ncbi:hypothetical protein PR202_gb18830 [Eleusine coracana subsp. coracana]|uniref:Probable purine permease n=1 Tax=Eleusine coracana subsp. coracana TaxID=191504 RepID=A0AAV5F776_ELECO|nr:hypothetical protein PR202_gb18830 [Eleusine coracana subsp. coracana]